MKPSPLPTTGALPTFLGIDIECDPEYEQKLNRLFVSSFTQAGEPKSMIDEFKQIVLT
jgi:hypothetical protein